MVTKDESIAYAQVMAVLNLLDEDDYNKIPKERIMLYMNNMDKEYKFNIGDCDADTIEGKLTQKSRAILANLYYRYIATKEEQSEIYNREKQRYVTEEIEKRKNLKINPVFENNKQHKTKNERADSNNDKNENLDLIVPKQDGLIKKIWKKLKKILRRT